MTEPNFENKAVGQDVTHAFEDFSRAFEAFRETNDDRLGQIEKRLSADVVTEEKLIRIDRAMDENKSRLDALLLKSIKRLLMLMFAQVKSAL
jgi:predicted phage gp36 major capsid-like protein